MARNAKWFPFDDVNMCSNDGPGAHFTNSFSIAIQIQWKFLFTLTSILKIDRYNIVYIARQLCCRGMRKDLLRSDEQQ